MSSYKENLNYGAPPLGFGKAKTNRRNMTEVEKLLWEHLRGGKLLGLKFRRQHPIGLYIADFYCHEKKLVIELDGAHHYLPEGIKYDKTRTFTLKLSNIRVLRFGNGEVLRHINSVLKKIQKELEK